MVMLKGKWLTGIKPVNFYMFPYISVLAKYLLSGSAHRTMCETR